MPSALVCATAVDVSNALVIAMGTACWPSVMLVVAPMAKVAGA
jgi:hypothetical protein